MWLSTIIRSVPPVWNPSGVALRFKHNVKQLTAADLVLILGVVTAAVLSAIWLWKSDSQKTVFIYKNDQLWGEYPLDKDQVIRIDSHNTVAISKGRVAMTHADCPDKRCVKQGFSKTLPIICLPNRVLIEILGREEEAPHILY
jgi:hypothetical protein